MNKMWNAFFVLMLVMAVSGSAFAYSSGPPAGYAGDPPNFNACVACHSSFPINTGDGSLSLTGITSYQPGQSYDLAVHLSDPGQQRWGFQIIAKDNANNFAQGSFTITDPTHTQNNLGYVNHTSAGTFLGATGADWNLTWNAPAEDVGPITFYFVGNAANGNGFNTGDYIYSQSLSVNADAQPYQFSVVFDTDFIPAGGGTINYTVTLTTSIPQAFPGVDYWSMVTLPDGSLFGPILTINNLTIPPNANISQTFALDVPGFAPPGNYQHHSHLGFAPNPLATASFNFTKGNTPNGTAPVDSWAEHGAFNNMIAADDAEIVSLPAEFSLGAAYPNPFNPSTSLNVNLPETANLNVAVYNTVGQQVAILARGQLSAGSHTLTFDASNLTSGVYFVHASANGWSDVQKVVLMK